VQTNTVFTPLSSFRLTGQLLVEPPVAVNFKPTGQSTNGVNVRDVGFSADGRAVAGTVAVLGGGIIEPGTSAYRATFTGTKES
jgi:hypothetical protein